MKKFIALFLALVLALGLMACASSATTETTTQPAETTTTTEETKTEEAAPAEETSEETAPAAAGSVYWLNFKPESDEVLQKVAAMRFCLPQGLKNSRHTFASLLPRCNNDDVLVP